MNYFLDRAARLALAAFFATAPLTASAADMTIVAGQRIGAAAFGMSSQQLVAALGTPQGKIHISDGWLLVFDDTRVVLAEDGHVIRIETENPGFKTADGFGVGSTEKDIAAKLGAPAKAADIKTSADNLQFPIGHRICYEPGLVFVTEFVPRQPHTVTRTILREGGCAHAFD